MRFASQHMAYIILNAQLIEILWNFHGIYAANHHIHRLNLSTFSHCTGLISKTHTTLFFCNWNCLLKIHYVMKFAVWIRKMLKTVTENSADIYLVAVFNYKKYLLSFSAILIQQRYYVESSVTNCLLTTWMNVFSLFIFFVCTKDFNK